MVRTARLDEVRSVAQFMTRFEQATRHVTVNVEHTTAEYTRLIAAGIAVFLILEDQGEMIGGLGALKYPDIHNGKMTACETFWFVDPAHRGKGLELLAAFEEWGRQQGCQQLAMIHLEDSYPAILERLYRINGYHLVEKHYIKEIHP